MASFRTHISFGVALGALGTAGMAGLFFAPAGWDFFMLTGLAATVGSIAPDIDSDSGLPFHITFASLSLVAGGLMLRYALGAFPGDAVRIAGYTLGAMVLVWGVIGTIFKKFTRHRGMAHSLPAAALAGLLTFTLASRSGFDDLRAMALGAALAAGYVLHLLLDEFHAAVNFHGVPFIPNKAFGSALKLTSSSGLVNAGVYLGVAYLVLQNYGRFSTVVAATLVRVAST